MSKQLKLKIVTPEKLILEELVDMVSIPTKEGEITILPDHIPLVAEITNGDIIAFSNNEHIPMEVVGGFVETKKENNVTEVTILADFAEHISLIGDSEIELAKEKAIKLKQQADNNEIVDFEHFETELERSLNRIKIADKWRTRKYRK